MHYSHLTRWSGIALACAGLVLLPGALGAQSVNGEAAAVVSTVSGSTTTLAGTGQLSSSADALSASLVTSAIPSLGSVDGLSSDTISSISNNFTPPDEVSSQASDADMVLNVKGHVLKADFVLSQVWAPVGGTPQPSVIIQNLTYDGSPLPVTGAQNQLITGDGMQLVIFEVQTTAGGTTVNALHLTAQDGSFDIIVAQSMAGVSGSGSSGSSGSGSSGSGSSSSGSSGSGSSGSSSVTSGVTSTVDNTVNSTTSTVDSTVNSTTSTVTSVTSGLGL